MKAEKTMETLNPKLLLLQLAKSLDYNEVHKSPKLHGQINIMNLQAQVLESDRFRFQSWLHHLLYDLE